MANSIILSTAKPALVLFVIRRNPNAPDLPCVLYCRITVNGVRSDDFSIGERVVAPKDHENPKAGEWASGTQKVKGNSAEALQINGRLDAIRYSIRAIETDLLHKGKPVTADILKKLYRGEMKLSYTFLELCDQFIEQQEKLIGIDITKETFRTYTVRRKNIGAFLKHIKREAIVCEEFNMHLAKQLITWLKTERKAGHNYCKKNLLLVKQTIKYAMQMEVLQYDPLHAFTIKSEKEKPIQCLNEAQVLKVDQYTCQSEKLNRIKDMFVFCCYTGLAYIDLKKFDAAKHVKYSPSAGSWIEMERQKTSEPFLIPLRNRAVSLIEKYKGKFPVLSNVKMNDYIKEVMAIVGLPNADTITWHQSRKTFGMIMLNSGVPIETVSRMLGHSSIRITQSTYAKVLMEKITFDTFKVYQALEIGKEMPITLVASSILQPDTTVHPIPFNGFRLLRSAIAVYIHEI